MPQGYLSFVLHAHLPYVRHPEHEYFLEESWFFEALTETYIPLLSMMDDFERDHIDFRLTMSLTPPLISMMTDGLLQERYIRHINKLIELAHKEVGRTHTQFEFNRTAHMYLHKFEQCRRVFEQKHNRNIVSGFKHFQDIGKLEIITCGATHGFLPLLRPSHEAVRAQIEMAVRHYTEHFGRAPRGIWLPECGYYEGLDEILANFGIRFFFVVSHGIINASSRPKYGLYAPLYCPSGVAAFGRDMESSKQVWSAREYIKPYIHNDGIRIMTGIKYHKITGKTENKAPYNPHAAWKKTADHAGDFTFKRQKQVEYLFEIMKRPPIIVAPYDAELFGHWWYEGIDWLNLVIRKITCDQKAVKLTTPWEYLTIFPKNQVAYPSESSWGNKGYAEVWCNNSNDWIYRHIHEAAWRMTEYARKYPNPDDNLKCALNQMARELMLLQSSDWAFIMNSGTMVEYAVKRTKEHIWRFNKLYEDIKNLRLDMSFLAELEWKDNIFPNMDYRIYS
ncbi:MAG: DUF1957 domain-containing protein [Deltaproteobacteria bacterium]|nr:DUF1957 domain-containing protein [Deltaproteobacteria bacterium]